MTRTCLSCGVDISHRPTGTKLCLKHFDHTMRVSGGTKAQSIVNRAVKKGLLPRAKTLTCVDCALPASDYDHRDYNKPLDVQPVCRSCNKLRGPAIPFKQEA